MIGLLERPGRARPDGRSHRDEIPVHELATVVVRPQVVANRGLFGCLGQMAGCLAIEAENIGHESIEPGTEQVRPNI